MLYFVDFLQKLCKICGRSSEPLLLPMMLSEEKESKNIYKRKTRKTEAKAKLRQAIRVIPIKESQILESSSAILLSIRPVLKS